MSSALLLRHIYNYLWHVSTILTQITTLRYSRHFTQKNEYSIVFRPIVPTYPLSLNFTNDVCNIQHMG